MSKQVIGIGTVANDGTGDPLRTAFNKANLNFTELYGSLGIPYIVGNWYNAASGSPGSPNSGLIKAYPFYVRDKITINALGVRISVTNAGNIQAAVYANNAATGRPTGNPLASTASLSTAAAVNVNAAVSFQIDEGWYWFATNCDNATATCISTQGLSAGMETSNVIGSATQANALGNQVNLSGVDVTQIFGTWPDLTAGSFTEAQSSRPIVQFKIASVP